MMESVILFLQIMLINILLSGDNSVVIALASRNLPPHQRSKAIWIGTIGAIVLRLILTVAAAYILRIPLIEAAGAILLCWIAIKLLVDDGDETHMKKTTTLLQAIWSIIVADLIMSLDNVLAIAAAAGDNQLMMILGIVMSMPIIIWGSTLVSKLLHKFPVLVYLGAAILGYSAGDMFAGDALVEQYLIPEEYQWIAAVGGAVLVIVWGWAQSKMKKASLQQNSAV